MVTQWTKGHARPVHVKEGLTTELDTWGNTGADGLAGKAADCSDIVQWPGPTSELRTVRGPRPGVDHLTPLSTASDKDANAELRRMGEYLTQVRRRMKTMD